MPLYESLECLVPLCPLPPEGFMRAMPGRIMDGARDAGYSSGVPLQGGLAQALDLGLLKEDERSWEVEDWRERVNAFGDRKSLTKSN